MKIGSPSWIWVDAVSGTGWLKSMGVVVPTGTGAGMLTKGSVAALPFRYAVVDTLTRSAPGSKGA